MPSLWTFLFGPFYLAHKGAITLALVWFLAALFTGGIFWLVAWIFAESALRKFYLQAGWKELPPEDFAQLPEPKAKRSAKAEAERQRKLTEVEKKMGC